MNPRISHKWLAKKLAGVEQSCSSFGKLAQVETVS
jgi:hypothetical protein